MGERRLLSFDVAAAAGVEPAEEALLSAAIDLETLGVEPAQIEQRQIGFWMQERLPDGQTVSVPAQAEFSPDPQGRIKLTWMAPRSASAPRRVNLELADRGNGKARPFPAVQVLPDANDRVWVSHDNRNLLGYCYSGQYRKPFFYPCERSERAIGDATWASARLRRRPRPSPFIVDRARKCQRCQL